MRSGATAKRPFHVIGHPRLMWGPVRADTTYSSTHPSKGPPEKATLSQSCVSACKRASTTGARSTCAPSRVPSSSFKFWNHHARPITLCADDAHPRMLMPIWPVHGNASRPSAESTDTLGGPWAQYELIVGPPAPVLRSHGCTTSMSQTSYVAARHLVSIRFQVDEAWQIQTVDYLTKSILRATIVAEGGIDSSVAHRAHHLKDVNTPVE